MPEGLKRLHNSGQAHFLTFSCYHRLPLLANMHMEDTFLRALEQTRQRFEMHVFGYVVMPEHIHLLVSEPAAGLLPSFMQILKRKVSRPARRQVISAAEMPHFWLERSFDHNVRNHQGFVTQLRYIHRNPVKRGLCAHTTRLEMVKLSRLGRGGGWSGRSRVRTPRRATRVRQNGRSNQGKGQGRRPISRGLIPPGNHTCDIRHRAPFSRLLSGAKAGSMNSDRQGFGRAPGFSRAIRPFGPTTNGNDNAFQLPSSSARHVFPSSREMSDPLVPAVIQTLRDSDH